MAFSSQLFVFYFLPAALLLYYASPRPARNLLLLLLSYLFYGWANPWFVFLMLGSTLVDYGCGLLMAAHPRTGLAGSHARRTALFVSVVVNLGLLGYFKYCNFAIDSYNQLLASLGLEPYQYRTFLRITLPLGISFYTFQSMSYTIDVYRGHVKPVRGFVDFACYVSMFPQLVAGPIVRFGEVREQLTNRTHSIEKFARGVTFFALGMAKKVVIADGCARAADVAFEADTLTPLAAWFGAVSFAFQIYFDFSAYSDLAVGLGLMLGFSLPLNFAAPYRAESVTDFWHRWHISLSSWLRDYLYIPLGGNRKGPSRTFVNLMTVMFLGGLWHGAAWTFVLWGLWHGVWLGIERAAGKRAVYANLPRLIRVALTFSIVVVSWVLFRAETWRDALGYWSSMAGRLPISPEALLAEAAIVNRSSVLYAAIAAIVVWLAPTVWEWSEVITWPRAALTALVLGVSFIVLVTKSYHSFIYFIF